MAQLGLLNVQTPCSASDVGAISFTTSVASPERDPAPVLGACPRLSLSQINTRKTWHRSCQRPLGDGKRGAIHLLKEVGKDREILDKTQSARPGTQQNHRFLWPLHTVKTKFTQSPCPPFGADSELAFSRQPSQIHPVLWMLESYNSNPLPYLFNFYSNDNN